MNNAGIPKRKHVLALTPEIVEDVMRINYFSPVRLTLASAYLHESEFFLRYRFGL